MAAKTWCERVILCTFVRSASLFVGLLLGQASGAQGFAPSQNASMNVQGTVACVSLAAGQGSALSRPLRPSGACVETETAAQEGLASGGETATSAPSAGPSLPEPMAEPPGLLSASTAPSATSTSTRAGPGVSSCSLTSGSTAPALGPQIAELLTAGLLPGASNEELEAALCPKFPDPCTFAEFEAIVGRRAYYVLTGRLRPLPAPLTLASAAARVRRQREEYIQVHGHAPPEPFPQLGRVDVYFRFVDEDGMPLETPVREEEWMPLSPGSADSNCGSGPDRSRSRSARARRARE